MIGFQNEPAGPEAADSNGKANLKSTRAYGCLFAILLGLVMSFVVFLGTMMGDCVSAEPDCHADDGFFILRGLAAALPIAALLGACMWLLAAALRAVLRSMIPEWIVSVLLVGLTLILVWLSIDPAFEVFFALTPQSPS